MDIRELKISGAWEITPRQFPDDRGLFLEAYKVDGIRNRPSVTAWSCVRPTPRSPRLAQFAVSTSLTCHRRRLSPSCAHVAPCSISPLISASVPPPLVSGIRCFSTTSTAVPSTSPKASATCSSRWRIIPPWCTCAPRARARRQPAIEEVAIEYPAVGRDGQPLELLSPKIPTPRACPKLASRACSPPGKPAKNSSPR